MKKGRATGIGGVFFKSKDPAALNSWYTQHLGLKTNPYGALFEFRNSLDTEQRNYLQLSPFPESTDYFSPSSREFMINFRVENLDALLEQLREAGIQQVGEIMRESYGNFAHIMDPEGNKIELWEPIHDVFKDMAGDDVNR